MSKFVYLLYPRISSAINHPCVFEQFFKLLVRMRFLTCRNTCEWQRVDRELGRLFVEDVSFAVIPVGETRHVRTHLHDGFIFFRNPAILWFLFRTLFAGVSKSSGCPHVHVVRVDDLCLFFKIESIFVASGDIHLGFICKALFVTGK